MDGTQADNKTTYEMRLCVVFFARYDLVNIPVSLLCARRLSDFFVIFYFIVYGLLTTSSTLRHRIRFWRQGFEEESVNLLHDRQIFARMLDEPPVRVTIYLFSILCGFPEAGCASGVVARVKCA